MKKKTKKIPDSVLACVWFANPKKFDWEKQKETVIVQVLNRGTWEALRWVYHCYGEKEIRKAVSNPARGVWFPQTLRFWCCFFHITLNAKKFQKAFLNLWNKSQCGSR